MNGLRKKAFISYRVEDSANFASQVFSYLGDPDKEGTKDLAVFMDIDKTLIGANFIQQIKGEIAESSILIAVIGPSWQEIHRERTALSSDDYYVVELQEAERLGIPILPVLQGNSEMPNKASLPVLMEEAVTVDTGGGFDSDMKELVARIHEILEREGEKVPSEGKTGKGRYIALFTGVALFIIAAIVVLIVTTRPPERDRSYTNSLDLKFVEVGDGLPLFCEHEVRVKDYRKFTEATTVQVSTAWKSASPKSDHPVSRVSRSDAENYCQWLTEYDRENLPKDMVYRLPTLEEWEAAYGEASSTGNPPDNKQGNLEGGDDGFEEVAPVCSYPPNEYGLFDMDGNVSEWLRENPSGDPLSTPTVKGGNWSSSLPEGGSVRPPNEQSGVIGFRIVLAPRNS